MLQTIYNFLSNNINLISLIGTAVTVSSFVFALMTNHFKKKLENTIKYHLAGIAGNIIRIRNNSIWADNNFRNIRDHALKLEKNEHSDLISKYAHDGSGNTLSAKDSLGILLNQVTTLQISQFGTEIIRYVDEDLEKIEKKGTV